jgi:hypothetical protein
LVGLAHIILSKKTKSPLMTGRKWVFKFWVFDKSNEEGLITNTNSAWLSQNHQRLIASTVWWAVGEV